MFITAILLLGLLPVSLPLSLKEGNPNNDNIQTGQLLLFQDPLD